MRASFEESSLTQIWVVVILLSTRHRLHDQGLTTGVVQRASLASHHIRAGFPCHLCMAALFAPSLPHLHYTHRGGCPVERAFQSRWMRRRLTKALLHMGRRS